MFVFISLATALAPIRPVPTETRVERVIPLYPITFANVQPLFRALGNAEATPADTEHSPFRLSERPSRDMTWRRPPFSLTATSQSDQRLAMILLYFSLLISYMFSFVYSSSLPSFSPFNYFTLVDDSGSPPFRADQIKPLLSPFSSSCI